MTVDVDFGDRVIYVDGDGDEHRALVVDPVNDAEFVTVVTGASTEFGEGYNSNVDVHTSVYPHADVGTQYTATNYAFKPGWDAEED